MRIAIVNDMPLAREALRRAVMSVPGLDVAWTAADVAQAVAAAKRDRPDLVLMDLMMPRVDGAEATRLIMAEAPCPILVVTATCTGHQAKVYEAMGHGALDAIDTPTLGPAGDVRGADALLKKIAMLGRLAGNPATRPRLAMPTPSPDPLSADGRPAMLLLGASTGGPTALAEILTCLPHPFARPILIVQHVDSHFAPGLADWLAQRVARPVTLARAGQEPRAGDILIAGSDAHLIIDAQGRLALVAEPSETFHRPSVDILFSTAAERWPVAGTAVLLTGMGRDGAEGLLMLRRRGWHTIAQDAATCVVPGMPRAAVEIGAAVEVLPLPEIGPAVASAASRTPTAMTARTTR